MANDGSVIIGTELDESGIRSGLDQLNQSVNRWGTAVVGSKAFQAITKALLSAAKAGINYNAQMEEYQTNFSVLLGDEAKALEYVAQMRETAAKTPFGMEDLASANQTLLSFGLSAEDATTAITQLGDISLGNSERLSSLSLAFAQVSSAGKLSGQDLLQMINAGFNPLNTIAEKTGTNLGDLKEVMAGGKGSKEFQKQMKAAQKEVKKMGDQASEGAKWLAQIGQDGMISAQMVGLAMEAETSPGGRFYKGMEQASQTMSGMWSTLKDDTSQLIGNVFEPVSGALKEYVLPAAQGVVSTLNSLFEEDNTVTISAETQTAIENVTSLDEDIAALKKKYVNETVRIRLEAENAQNVVAELEAVQAKLERTPKKLWTDEDKQTLQALTAQLTSIYPELQQYVGNDGIIKLEAQEVAKLVTEYQNLALAKAAAQYRSDAEIRVEEAKIQQAIIENERDALVEQKKAAEDLKNEYVSLSEESAQAFGSFLTPDGMPENLNTGMLENYLSLVERFIQLSGGTEGLDGESPIRDLIGADGQVVSADQVMADIDLLGQLASALTEIDTLSQVQSKAQDTVIQEVDAAIATTNTAVETAKANVAATVVELEKLEAALARINGEGAEATAGGGNEAKEAGSGITTDMATGVEENSGTLDTAVQNTVDGSTSSADTSGANDIGQNIAKGAAAGVDAGTSWLVAAVKRMVAAAIRAAKGSLDINSPSGVFRDEVGMFIPSGAAQGVDKNAWMLASAVDDMVGNSIPDMSAVASNIANGAVGRSPMAGSLPQVFNQTNNFNLPVETPDEFAQTMRIYNTYGLAAQG